MPSIRFQAMNDLIYNQKDIPADQWRYGLRSSASTGCGWIATYNALRLMGYQVEIPRLISYYEHQLPLIHGTFGTSFWGPAQFFRHWGFPVKMVFDRDRFDSAAQAAPVCILFFRWKKGLKLGAHFVALRHNGSQFIGFNTYSGSHSPDPYGESLSEFIRKRHYFGCVLLTIEPRT